MNVNGSGLRQIVAYLRERFPVETTGHLPDVTVRGVAFDSRRVELGDIFVAVPGFRDDGYRYWSQAAGRGAAAVVAEVAAPDDVTPPWLRVPDARLALAHLATVLFEHPSSRLFVAGITGTNGKTTTACLLQFILNASGRKAGLLGTLEVDSGRRRQPARLTTPEAPEIQGLFREMHAAGVRHAVMEVSAHGVALHRVTGIDFALGAVLNIDLDHLDFAPRFEDYVRAKRGLVELIRPGRPVLLNIDDPTVAGFMAVRPEAITISAVGPADVTITDIREGWGETRCNLRVHRPLTGPGAVVRPGTFPVATLLPGRHNVYNVAVAFVSALLAGVDPATAAAAVTRFAGVSRRLEYLYRGDFLVLDDTALNPASIDAVFAVVAAMPFRKLVVVNALRGNRGPAINCLIAAALARWVERLELVDLICTSSVSHVGPNDRVGAAEEQAFRQALERAGVGHRYFTELPVALAEAVARVAPGDILLLLGAQGMDEGRRLVREMLDLGTVGAEPQADQAGVDRCFMCR